MASLETGSAYARGPSQQRMRHCCRVPGPLGRVLFRVVNVGKRSFCSAGPGVAKRQFASAMLAIFLRSAERGEHRSVAVLSIGFALAEKWARRKCGQRIRHPIQKKRFGALEINFKHGKNGESSQIAFARMSSVV